MYHLILVRHVVVQLHALTFRSSLFVVGVGFLFDFVLDCVRLYL